MKIAVIGSRRRLDRESVVAFVNGLAPDVIVISGACRGPDRWAVEAAKARGLETEEFAPDLSGCKQRHEFTKRYYERNQRVVDACDSVVAFVASDRKGGTEDTIKRALAANKPVDVRMEFNECSPTPSQRFNPAT
jgi:hypothetical protein